MRRVSGGSRLCFRGTLLGAAQTCSPVPCPALTAPAHGSLWAPGGFVFPQRANVSCALAGGFVLDEAQAGALHVRSAQHRHRSCARFVRSLAHSRSQHDECGVHGCGQLDADAVSARDVAPRVRAPAVPGPHCARARPGQSHQRPCGRRGAIQASLPLACCTPSCLIPCSPNDMLVCV